MSAGPGRTAWLSFPGPVFRRELGSASRSGWIYLVRALAAAALAAYVASSVGLRQELSGAEGLTLGKIAELAERSFAAFVLAQFYVVLAVVPLLVAGSVAEEKARGTLGLILAGRLSSAEIVADKLAARMLTVLVLMLAALPVIPLIGLLGGIDPTRLALSYLGTISAAWFAAVLSMLVSVHARSASGAIVGAYATMLAWIVAPVWFAAWLGQPDFPGFVARVLPVARELARTSPLSIQYQREVWGGWVTTPAEWARMMGEMASLQAIGGLIMFALAAWRLRPVYRAQVGAGPASRRGWLGRVAGLRGGPKPPCGDDPIAWKERYAPESAWLARMVLLAALGLIAYVAVEDARYNLAYKGKFYAFEEMFVYGLDIGPLGADGVQRAGLNYQLCESAAILVFAALVAVAVLSASGVAGERARGTWEGLLSTPLERRAILRAKMRGSVRAVRPLLFLAGFFYLISLAATALHPVGFVLGVVAVAASVWFATALGTYVSLRSRNANQAIGRTVLILAAVDLGPAALLFPFVGVAASMAASPFLAMSLPISRMHFLTLSRAIWAEPGVIVALLIALGVVLARAVAAWFLTRAALRRIERDEG